MSDPVIQRLMDREPCLWANPRWQPAETCLSNLPITYAEVEQAGARLRRFAALLANLFPELRPHAGVIESPLLAVPWSAVAEPPPDLRTARLLVKADHTLPVAGSIKARGGIHAVLRFAEQVATESGLLRGRDDDYRRLARPAARECFARYEVTVGSTGNLGMSVGIMGAALGFRVTVHMSSDAKTWKKHLLCERAVSVVEHDGDYTTACASAREQAAADPKVHFVDDEHSLDLFLGYAAAVPHVRDQLREVGIHVDSAHPLFLYLPCGVGGAPGGITFAARHLFGDEVHCFVAEPVDAPCMLLGLLTGRHAGVSVHDVGLHCDTDADGLAVARPSGFVAELMDPLLDGGYTVTDRQLYGGVATLHDAARIDVEPSAAAGCGGPAMLGTQAGRSYLAARGLDKHLASAAHIVWTTGGALVPPELHAAFRDRARREAAAGLAPQ